MIPPGLVEVKDWLGDDNLPSTKLAILGAIGRKTGG